MKINSNKIFLKYDLYLDILIDYLSLNEFKTLSPLTISSKRLTVTSLMNYLGDNEVRDFSQCKQKHVTEYINSIANLSSSTISGRSFLLRHFFNYLNKENITLYSGDDIFPVWNGNPFLNNFYKECCNLYSTGLT